MMQLLRWCLNFASTATFGGGMNQKPNSDIGVIDLTSRRSPFDLIP